MTDASLNDLLTLINQQLLQYEALSAYLSKAEALAEVALTNGFIEQEEDTQRHYLWAIRDLLTEAYLLNEKLIHIWLRNHHVSI